MKPENNFIARIHKYLPAALHREKMHNAYRGGTPDVWYSGSVRDLWVEYKYIQHVPKRSATRIPVDLSDLQRQWINRRLIEGRNIAVIIGCARGGYILPTLDFQPDTETFLRSCIPAKDLAHCITHFTTRKERDETDPVLRTTSRGHVPAPVSVHLPLSTV